MPLQFRVSQAEKLTGEIRVPGDKSISHRALMLGAIAEGKTPVSGFLFGEDNLATLTAMQQLGVRIDVDHHKKTVSINGVGKYGLLASSSPLNMGNSGTAMRLLSGLLAGQHFESVLIGDASLSKRPMARVVKPLRDMGAHIDLSADDTAPVRIQRVQSLQGISYSLPIASAQVKSALLLAGLYAYGETKIIEPLASRDHTEKMLQTFSYPVTVAPNKIQLNNTGKLIATPIEIPADISSAAFFMVAASIVPGSRILLTDVGINPTRTGIIHLLQMMGADIRIHHRRYFCSEPVADIEVRYSQLKGIDIPIEQVPLAIDEMPILMIAASCAQGITRLSGAEELRVKETDRISAMATGLTNLGIICEVQPDGIIIQGGYFRGGRVQSFTDHRIAMAFAVAGCVADGELIIDDCDNVKTSFPDFINLAQHSGFQLAGAELVEGKS